MTCRSYCPHIRLNNDHVQITDPAEIHHIKDVLRLKAGEDLCVFDGSGTEYAGVIRCVDSAKIDVEIQNILRHKSVRPAIILACAIPKKGKFEMIIEKAAELGVDELIPLLTRRTEVVLKKESFERKKQRFENVAVSAAKQCGRATVPLIHTPMKPPEALKYLQLKTTVLVPSLETQRKPLLEIFENVDLSKGVSFMIGPEGDFTPDEYRMFHEAGCIPVSLGPTVLRVETAAISVMAAAQLYFDKTSVGECA